MPMLRSAVLQAFVLVALVGEAAACCRALTAQCYACQQNVTIEVYCQQHPSTNGCDTVSTPSPPTMFPGCATVRCRAGYVCQNVGGQATCVRLVVPATTTAAADTTRPTRCTCISLWAPVCYRGTTYSNTCQLNCSFPGVRADYTGACSTTTPPARTTARARPTCNTMLCPPNQTCVTQYNATVGQHVPTCQPYNTAGESCGWSMIGSLGSCAPPLVCACTLPNCHQMADVTHTCVDPSFCTNATANGRPSPPGCPTVTTTPASNTRPTTCPCISLWAPVCYRGTTYSNTCQLNCTHPGVRAEYNGECSTTTAPTRTTSVSARPMSCNDVVCGSNQTCATVYNSSTGRREPVCRPYNTVGESCGWSMIGSMGDCAPSLVCACTMPNCHLIADATHTCVEYSFCTNATARGQPLPPGCPDSTTPSTSPRPPSCPCIALWAPLCYRGTTYSNTCVLNCRVPNATADYTGECTTTTTAPARTTSVSVPRTPCPCISLWAPVCYNGRTYSNTCELNCSVPNVQPDYNGACSTTTPSATSPGTGTTCAPCAEIYQPVCYNGTTYGNMCEMNCAHPGVTADHTGECVVTPQSTNSNGHKGPDGPVLAVIVVVVVIACVVGMVVVIKLRASSTSTASTRDNVPNPVYNSATGGGVHTYEEGDGYLDVTETA